MFLEEVAGREDGLHIRRGNSKGMSEDNSRGSRGGIILDSGDNGGLDYFLLRGRVIVFCIFLHNLLPLGAEGGVRLPVTALPIYAPLGRVRSLEKMKPSKQAWSDPFLPRMKERVGSESEIVEGSSKSER